MAATLMKDFVFHAFNDLFVSLGITVVVNGCKDDEGFCLVFHANDDLFVSLGVAAVVNGCNNDEGFCL
eukprot:9335988-Ditylum_brightwellii.AAC.1